MANSNEYKNAYLNKALQDFQQARRRADLREIFARLTGKSTELLSYEEVRQKLHAREIGIKELKEIPLDKIVGSVGRYTDFTRDFLPLQDSAKSRWVSVMLETSSLKGLPPIDVYKLGEAYFVLDGNHRVSVARQLGSKYIEAYVKEVKTKVPIDESTQPDDLIVKAEQVEFLEATMLDITRPEADLSVTAPGRYPVLLEHIDVHRYFIGIEQKRFIPFEEAALSWYDTVFLPVVQIFRERGVLRHFPGRTETDLYIWLAGHRAWLSQRLGWDIEPDLAVEDLTIQHGEEQNGLISKATRSLLKTLTFDTIDTGPPPGEWRTTRVAPREDERLFPDLLVSITGQETGWIALEQAIALAQKEGSNIHGIHIIQDKGTQTETEYTAMEAEFNQRCEQANINGKLIIEEGTIAQLICERARFTDLVISRLVYPPSDQLLSRLSSGYRTMIQKCPRPILTVSSKKSDLTRALLAFDGSPKSYEAMYIAAYLVGTWNIPLTVLTVADGVVDAEIKIGKAKQYFGDNPLTNFEIREGAASAEILKLTNEQNVDLILCGGYSHVPIVEVVFGSIVDHLLREADIPILICR